MFGGTAVKVHHGVVVCSGKFVSSEFGKALVPKLYSNTRFARISSAKLCHFTKFTK